jgi:hypothetical protein
MEQAQMESNGHGRIKRAIGKVENLEYIANDGNTYFLNAGNGVTQKLLNMRLCRLDRELRNRGLKLMLFGKERSMYDLHANDDGVTVGVVIVDEDGPDTEADITVEK